LKVTKETIGLRIGKLRSEKNITQKELAQKSGVGLSTIKNTESGNQGRTLSKIDDLLRIAEALDVSPYFLLTANSEENHIACEELGLSNDTINKLKNESTLHRVQFIHKAIDYLTSYSPALLSIYTYLTADYKAVETDDKYFSANDLERIDRLSVLDELEVLRKLSMASFRPDFIKKIEDEMYHNPKKV
jgi:transcriptional regulator with XRE-family HTH domain